MHFIPLLLAMVPLFKPGPAVEIATCWNPRFQSVPDKLAPERRIPGVVGQLFLFGKKYQNVAPEGRVTVEAFDPLLASDGRLIATWKFDRETLKKCATRDERLGLCTVLFLPWPESELNLRRVKFTVRFDPDKGKTLHAPASTHTLDAEEKPRPEPKYEGKPLSYWLEKLQKAETDEQRQQASSIICEFGPDAASAVPLMVEMLHDHSDNYRARVEQMLVAVGPAAKGAVPDLIKMLERNPPRAAREACTVLAAIGPDAKPALPAIRKVLLEQTAGEKKLTHGIDPFPLHRIGPDAAPILAEAVVREPADELFTVNALMAIAELGPEAKPVASKLRPLLKSESRGVRMSAAAALGVIEQNAEAVTVLVKFIDDEESAQAAVKWLGRIGPAAKDALPALKKLVKSDEGNINIELARRRAEFQEILQAAIRKIEAMPKK